MKDYESIVVSRGNGSVIIKKNPTPYILLGKGNQGAVFKLSPEKCIKIYGEKSHRCDEEKVLKLAEGSPFFPELYETGTNYLVMEYIKGTTVKEILREKKYLPKEITEQIISLIREMKRLDLPRRDPKLRHMIITENNEMKIIDHVNTLKNKKKPEKLFQGLKNLGLLESFLKQVKEIDRPIYEEWKKSMKTYF